MIFRRTVSLASAPRHSFSTFSAPIVKTDLVDGVLETLNTQPPTTNEKPYNRGYGKIVAVASQSAHSSRTTTHLTDLRHKSPMRLVPSRRSHPANLQNEPALLHLSSYGGGLVPGDSLHLDIDVRGQDAVLCILTQGGQRIYRPGEEFRKHVIYNYDGMVSNTNAVSSSKVCLSALQCTVEPFATLLYLPDPTVPYHQSSFEERRDITCQHDGESMGSVIAVDWYGSGRRLSTGMEEERWAFDYLATRTELYTRRTDERPDQRSCVMRESMVFDNTVSRSNHLTMRTPAAISLGQTIDSMATLLLHGPFAVPVAKRAISLSHYLASTCTRTRSEMSSGEDSIDDDAIETHETLLQSLGGKVLVSITQIKDSDYGTYLVRVLAECNEDIYRVLHHCLKPCSPYLGGLEPYRERIYSTKTVRGPQTKDATGTLGIPIQMQQEKKDKQFYKLRVVELGKAIAADRQIRADLRSITNFLIFDNGQEAGVNNVAWFRLCHLSDSALPVGSFAHSLGVEAAAQMKLFVDDSSTKDKIIDQPWSSDSTATCSPDTISDYIHAVTRSSARFSTPLILAGYSLLVLNSTENAIDFNQMHQSWLEIDAYVNTLLSSNEPGRRASMDQGLGLLRIIPSFTGCGFHHHHHHQHHNNSASDSNNVAELWELIRQSADHKGRQSSRSLITTPLANGHAAPIYGIFASSLGISPLDTCRVFSFGIARDVVSAAVRLNLVGPMVGLSILDGVGRGAAEEGLEMGIVGMLKSNEGECFRNHCDETKIKSWLHSVASCAPLMDTVQPLHDLLAARLFRT